MSRSFLVALALVAPTFLAANPTVANDLAAAHDDAVALRTSADNLQMLARTPMKYSFEAHSTELARARKYADAIAVRLNRLNAERDSETPAQREQIDLMQARLVDAVRNIDVAIQAFNHRNTTASLYSPAYQNRVKNLVKDAQALANPTSANQTSAD
ncbi:MAG: hypothetical protein R2748_27340 [Bryobacterales bacterium]